MSFEITTNSFGNVNGVDTKLYTVKHNNCEFSVTDYGATLVSYKIPNKKHTSFEIIAGFDSVDKYVSATYYFGSTIGRYAGRIKNAKSVIIDNQPFSLTSNDNQNILHGGTNAISDQIWQSTSSISKSSASIEFSYTSADLDNGFPGEVVFHAKYSLNLDNELTIEYTAKTNKATLINMTNHGYYSLNLPNGDILDHNLTVNASQYVEVDNQLIPTGRLLECANSVYDINRYNLFDEFIQNLNQQNIHSLDLSYVLPYRSDNSKILALDIHHKPNQCGLKICTNQNVVHLFTTDRLKNVVGANINKEYAAIAIECQNFSDLPNNPHFGSALLKPGQTYYNYICLTPYLI